MSARAPSKSNTNERISMTKNENIERLRLKAAEAQAQEQALFTEASSLPGKIAQAARSKERPITFSRWSPKACPAILHVTRIPRRVENRRG